MRKPCRVEPESYNSKVKVSLASARPSHSRGNRALRELPHSHRQWDSAGSGVFIPPTGPWTQPTFSFHVSRKCLASSLLLHLRSGPRRIHAGVSSTQGDSQVLEHSATVMPGTREGCRSRKQRGAWRFSLQRPPLPPPQQETTRLQKGRPRDQGSSPVAHSRLRTSPHGAFSVGAASWARRMKGLRSHRKLTWTSPPPLPRPLPHTGTGNVLWQDAGLPLASLHGKLTPGMEAQSHLLPNTDSETSPFPVQSLSATFLSRMCNWFALPAPPTAV